ncbi:MAG: ABC transporter ATP-binding protein [Deinococcota bacterium]
MILRCHDLVRTFETAGSELEVLRGVTLELAPAQVIAILGPSGSGKSTLLHLLGGLDRPTSGEIFWADHNLTNLNQSQLAKLRSEVMGLIFQSHYLLEDLSVLENVSLPGRIKGKLDTARAKDLLAQVGLSERVNAFPKTLSGGERQRVAVARALYSRPQIILADEPTGSLDRHNAKAVYQLLVDLARREGSAVVMVTHDEGLVHDIDQRYHLSEGLLQPVSQVDTQSETSDNSSVNKVVASS